MFDVDESFDLLPADTQTHHLERMRLFYIVARHNWSVALGDKRYNEDQKLKLKILEHIANLKPRTSRRPYRRPAPASKPAQRKK